MSLQDQLNEDLKDAMRNKDALKRTVLRGVVSALREEEQSKREDLVNRALKKHNVTKPSGDDDMAAYQQALDAALAAENVEENAKLDEGEELRIIQKMVKQRQDSIDEAQKVGRSDVAESEQAELTILEAYLPKQLSREEIEAEARAIIEQAGAESMKDMGKVMGPLMENLQGRADGKLISEVVRGLLS